MNMDPRSKQRLVDDFFEVQRDSRTMYFRTRTAGQNEVLYPILAEDERLQVTDVLALEEPYRTCLLHHLAGFPQKGINSTHRTFFVKPVGQPVQLEIGTKNNTRRYLTIDRKKALPVETAINALFNYGPYALVSDQRGMLQEVPEIEDPPPDSEALEEDSTDQGKKKRK